MFVLINLLIWCVFGFVAGAVARALMPGADKMGCLATILLGVAGSLVGGFIWSILFRPPWASFEPGGLVLAVIGAMLVLWGYRKYKTQSR